MVKTFVFVILLAACNVHCNMTSTGREEKKCLVNLELAMQKISQSIYHFSNCTKNTKAELKKAADCADIFNTGHNKSGIYEIWPVSRMTEVKSFNVYCDMDTTGGGWTVIQRRGDFNNLKDYFYKNWESYKKGFGHIEEDFWLGNDNIFVLTHQKQYSVRFDLKDIEQNRKYALYEKFWIDDEINKYTLHIDVYSGDAGDSMTYHNGQKFTTFDQGNDKLPVGNCAVQRKGAWWYNACDYANLNGQYYEQKYTGDDGILWHKWKGESLAWTEIKIRPKNFKADFLPK